MAWTCIRRAAPGLPTAGVAGATLPVAQPAVVAEPAALRAAAHEPDLDFPLYLEERR